jgi:hypothetical protein
VVSHGVMVVLKTFLGDVKPMGGHHISWEKKVSHHEGLLTLVHVDDARLLWVIDHPLCCRKS